MDSCNQWLYSLSTCTGGVTVEAQSAQTQPKDFGPTQEDSTHRAAVSWWDTTRIETEAGDESAGYDCLVQWVVMHENLELTAMRPKFTGVCSSSVTRKCC